MQLPDEPDAVAPDDLRYTPLNAAMSAIPASRITKLVTPSSPSFPMVVRTRERERGRRAAR
jgi:hypothetical protein